MNIIKVTVCFWCILLVGCSKPQEPKKIVATINNYEITAQEFEEGFAQSPFASRQDKAKARAFYINNLINKKLVLQDAQKKNLDKNKEFLQSIERFWEQSLLMQALAAKSKEITGTTLVSQEEVRKVYDQMVKDGLTTKSFEELYPQIKLQAQKQKESQLLNDWIDGLRKTAQININQNLIKADQ